MASVLETLLDSGCWHVHRVVARKLLLPEYSETALILSSTLFFFKGHNFPPKPGADRSSLGGFNPKMLHWKTASSRFPNRWEKMLSEFLHGLRSILPTICWRAELTRASEFYFMAPGSFPGKRCSTLPAWRHGHTHKLLRARQGVKAQGCLFCLSCPAKSSPSSPDAEQLTPMHGRRTHCGAWADGGTVTIEKLRHCQPTPLLFSPRHVCVTIPTCSEPRGSGGRRRLQHAERVTKPFQTFCSAVTAPCYLCCFQHKFKPCPHTCYQVEN